MTRQKTVGQEVTAWPRWGAGLALASGVLFGVGLVMLPAITSLEEAGGGCIHLVAETPAPFILLGLSSLALTGLPVVMASERAAGQPGNGALAALLILTLLMGLLLQAGATSGVFFLTYFVASAVIYLPLVGIVIQDRSKLSEVHRAMAYVLLGLIFAYPWLAYAVAPHPIPSC